MMTRRLKLLKPFLRYPSARRAFSFYGVATRATVVALFTPLEEDVTALLVWIDIILYYDRRCFTTVTDWSINGSCDSDPQVDKRDRYWYLSYHPRAL